MARNKRLPALVETMHAYGADLKHRELYLTSDAEAYVESDEEPGVEHVMATKFIKNLRFLSASCNDPILVHMKTCGGM